MTGRENNREQNRRKKPRNTFNRPREEKELRRKVGVFPDVAYFYFRIVLSTSEIAWNLSEARELVARLERARLYLSAP
jgi:hypothetical protein